MTLTHEESILLALLIILLIGTFKIGFKQTLIGMALAFIIDQLIGAPIQNALNINFSDLYLAFMSLIGLDKVDFSSVINYIKEFFSLW